MENDGVLQDKILGGRVFVLSAKTFVETINLLSVSMSQQATDALMWNIGHRYGLALGNKVKSKSPDDGIMLLSSAALNSGWGVPRVINNFWYSGEVEVSFKNCVFCEGLSGESNPRCYLLNGILTGIAEAVYHSSFKTDEKECRAVQNSDVCRFTIKRI
ncbi:MAG: hypothetical protein NZ941_04015 [Candidatus Caldarchaeum sp.]|nr:hypothetical protein [Candidatus Caldarchaeum sp.]